MDYCKYIPDPRLESIENIILLSLFDKYLRKTITWGITFDRPTPMDCFEPSPAPATDPIGNWYNLLPTILVARFPTDSITS